MVALAQLVFGVTLIFVLPTGLKLIGTFLPVESAAVTISCSLLRRCVISIAVPLVISTVCVYVLGLNVLPLPARPV